MKFWQKEVVNFPYCYHHDHMVTTVVKIGLIKCLWSFFFLSFCLFQVNTSQKFQKSGSSCMFFSREEPWREDEGNCKNVPSSPSATLCNIIDMFAWPPTSPSHRGCVNYQRFWGPMILSEGFIHHIHVLLSYLPSLKPAILGCVVNFAIFSQTVIEATGWTKKRIASHIVKWTQNICKQGPLTTPPLSPSSDIPVFNIMRVR